MPDPSWRPDFELDADLEAASARVAALDARVEAALADPFAPPDQVQRLLEELRAAEAARDRLRSVALLARQQVHEAPSGPAAERQSHAGSRVSAARARRPTMSVREQVLAGLELLGVPAAPRTVAEAASARTGLPVDARQLASLRRSDQASWEALPDRRPAYLVPALHAARFEPLRGQLASSAWELSRRIVGPLSPRADHLRATIRLAEHLAWARQHAEASAPPIETLLWRHARSVAGALDAPARGASHAIVGGLGAPLDPAQIAAAARAELQRIDAEDRAERQRAAERAARLPRAQQLFGAGIAVLEGRDGTAG